MPIIKPISSLRNKTREIASLCHDQDEPVYLTTNGEGDLVVMSIEHYEKLNARIELFEKLSVAQSQSVAGGANVTVTRPLRAASQVRLGTNKRSPIAWGSNSVREVGFPASLRLIGRGIDSRGRLR